MDRGSASLMATAVGLVVVLSAFASAVVLVAGPGAPLDAMAHGDTALERAVLGALASGLLAVAAAAGLLLRIGGIVPAIALLVALASLAGAAAGTTLGRPLVPGLASASPPLLASLLGALVLGVGLPARGSGLERRRRLLVRASLAMVVGAVVIAAIRTLAYDPYFDLACLRACGHGPVWLAVGEADRTLLTRLSDGLAIVVGGPVAIAASTMAVRRGSWSGVTRALVLGAALGAAGCALAAIGRASAPSGLGIASAGGTLLVAGTAVMGIALAWSVVRGVRLRVRLARTARDLGADETADVAAALRGVFGDAFVSLAYVVPDGSGVVDARGEPRTEPIRDGDRETTIRWQDRPVALIRHGPGVDPDSVVRGIPSPLLAALDNERLRATGLANLRALRASRAQTVAAEDEVRRRLERDLHDGVQQRLLALAFELHHARTESAGSRDRDDVARLAQAEDEALAALDELRRIARGVHPAILGQSGLGAALSSFAEDAPIPLSLTLDRTARYPPLVEATAYRLVVDAVADAAATGSSHAAIHVVADATTMELEIDLAAGSPGPTARMADRVGAAGGTLVVERQPADHTRIRAVMPCA